MSMTTLQRLDSASLAIIVAGFGLTLQAAIPASAAGKQSHRATCNCFWAGWDAAEKQPQLLRYTPQSDGCTAISEKQDWKRGFYQQRFGSEPTCQIVTATAWPAHGSNSRD